MRVAVDIGYPVQSTEPVGGRNARLQTALPRRANPPTCHWDKLLRLNGCSGLTYDISTEQQQRYVLQAVSGFTRATHSQVMEGALKIDDVSLADIMTPIADVFMLPHDAVRGARGDPMLGRFLCARRLIL